MRNNKRYVALWAMLAISISAACHAQDSIQTVDALLAAENKAVVEKMKAVQDALSPPKAQAVKKAVKGPPSLVVKAVYGPSASVKTDLVYDGQTFIGAGPGDSVGPCKITAISGVCIALQRASMSNAKDMGLSPGESIAVSKTTHKKRASKKDRRKAMSAAAMAASCPSACWTEPPPVMPAGIGSPFGSFPSSGEAPRFSPPVMTNGERTLAPTVAPAMGLGAVVSQPNSPMIAPRPMGDVRLRATLSGSAN